MFKLHSEYKPTGDQPQAIEYLDIRRVGYNSTLKCIVNKYYEEK